MADLPPRRRASKKGARGRIERMVKNILLGLSEAILPRLYLAYMWLVWKTSRVREFGPSPDTIRGRYGRGAFALWHDEVFFVAYSFRRFRPHTLVSHSDFGGVIARILKLCQFTVFRGGSSSRRSRRDGAALNDMIESMKTQDGVLCGITVDGSNGPPYRVKPGVINIAIACQSPLLVERTWCRRYFRLNTWDRTIVPLPLNDIVHVYAGPYSLPPGDEYKPEALEAFRGQIENELLKVTYYAHTLIDGSDSQDVLKSFPDGWVPDGQELVLDRSHLA